MNDTSRVSAKKVIQKIGGAQKKIDIASSQGYATREILLYDHDECLNVECPCFHKGNLTKHKKRDTGALRTTSWYSGVPISQTVTAGTSVIVDVMSLIGEIGIEKNPKVSDVFDSAWGTILAASNSDRIKIACYTCLKASIKKLTRIGRANKGTHWNY